MEKIPKARPLIQIVREKFLGPFQLRAIAARDRAGSTESVKFIPVDEDRFVSEMELGEDNVRIFPVAAFLPHIGQTYNCLARRRGDARIVEAIPQGWETLTGREWQPNPVVCDFEIVFEEQNDRWWARHPKTGQVILPHKEWEMPAPGADGKIHITPATVELRPTATRTFFVAGPVGTLAPEKVSDWALDTYEGNGEKYDFSYASMFVLFGKWWTAFDVFGNPFVGIFDVDEKSLSWNVKAQVDEQLGELDQWVAKVAMFVLHPNFLLSKDYSGEVLARLQEIADETRNNLMAMQEWYRAWVDATFDDLMRRKVAKKPLTVKVPAPVGEHKSPIKKPLVEFDQNDLIKLLLTTTKPGTAKSATKPSTRKDKPAETAAAKGTTAKAATKGAAKAAAKDKAATKPPAKPRGKGRTELKAGGGHSTFSIGELNGEAASKLTQLREELEGNEPKGNWTKGLGVSEKDAEKIAGVGYVSMEDFATNMADPDRRKDVAKTFKISKKILDKAYEAAKAATESK